MSYGPDRFGIFRNFNSRWLFLPSSSDRFGVLRLFNSRSFLLPSSSNRLGVFRNFNSRSWFLSLACSWLLLINFLFILFSKDGYDRAACGISLNGISFNGISSFAIGFVRDWDLNLIVLD